MKLVHRFRNALAAVVVGCAVPVAAQTVDVVLTNSLVEPHSLVVDSQGSLYITDQGGLSLGQPAANRVMKFVPTTGVASILAGSFTGLNGTNNNSTPNAGYSAQFFNPAGIVQARGGLVVAD